MSVARRPFLRYGESGAPSLWTDDLELTYEYGPEMLRSAQKQGRVRLKNGTATIRCGTMTSPGFLRCKVWAEYDGERYEGLATAAFEPTRIRPTVTEPAAFDTF